MPKERKAQRPRSFANVGDEVGGCVIVYALDYRDKDNNKIHNCIGINRKRKYIAFRTDSKGVYMRVTKKRKLQDAILKVHNKMKKEIKLKHKP